MNILSVLIFILKNDFLNFKKNIFGLVTDVYVTVGEVYELLKTINDDTASGEMVDMLASLVDVIYILAGVFMLFRITVSFINMIIDPDKVSDKQVGAGSIIKRLFISVLMLIAFQPSSFVMDFLDKVESAIIDSDDGLLANITAQITTSNTNYNLLDNTISNVNASNDLECIYVHKVAMSVGSGSSNNYLGSTIYYQYDYKNVIKLSFSNVSGSKSIYTNSNLKDKNKTNWYVTIKTGSTTDSDGNTWKFTNELDSKNFVMKKSDINKTINSSKCPGNIITNNSYVQLYKSKSVSNGADGYFYVESDDKIAEYIAADFIKLQDNHSEATWDSSTGNKSAISKYIDSSSFLADEDLAFARSLLKAFIKKYSNATSETDEKIDKLLSSESANEEVYNIAVQDDPEININYILSIIVAIAVIVYLLLLCVEVVVRNLKLLVLKVIAPIPIISYIDPKDKIFNSWIKMYFTVYVDLFIKMLSISLAVVLLEVFFSGASNVSGLIKIVYLFGIFVFVKAIPSIINKLFGIDMSSSSFKEIGKTAKAGLGIAAGGAIAAGVGAGSAALAIGAAAKSGQSKGNIALAAASGIGNAVRGTLRGIGSGSKGNITGGLSMASRNMNNRNAYRNGIGASAIVGSTMLGGLGMDYATRMDREMSQDVDTQKNLTEFAKYKSQIDDIAESSDYMKSLRSAVATGQVSMSEDELKTQRKKWIEAQMSGNSDSMPAFSYKDKTTGTVREVKSTIEAGKRDNLNKTLNNARLTYEGNKDVQDAYRIKLMRDKLNLGDNDNKSYEEMAQMIRAQNGGNAALETIEYKVKSGIGSYEILKDAEAGANHQAGVIENRHTEIKASERYRQSVAARDAIKNNGGSH